MTVHIDELITEVTTVPEAESPNERRPDPCDERDRLRDAIWRAVRDHLRTRAEGFDD